VRSELDNRVKLGIAGGKSGDREREITIVSRFASASLQPALAALKRRPYVDWLKGKVR